MALTIRSVISRFGKLKWEWTAIPTTSSRARTSSLISRVPSLLMLTSAPLRIVIPLRDRLILSISAICLRRFDLSLILSQFRRDESQTQRLIDLLFGLAGNAFIAAKEAILIQLEPLLLGDLPERDIMVFATGEIIERRAETLPGHHPEIHVHPVFQ